MSGVGGVGSNNNYIPGVGDPGGAGGTGGTGGVGGAGDVGGAGATTPPSGQVQAPLSLGGNTTGVVYTQPSPLDPSNLVLPASINDSTNVDITACLVLLMQTANQMRKDQREEWIKESQNALASADNAAELQKQAALMKFVGEAVTDGASAVSSIGQAAVSIGGAAKDEASMKATEADADSKFGSEEQIKSGGTGGTKQATPAGEDEDPEINNQAKGIIGSEGLTPESIGGESLTEGGEEGATPEQKTVQKVQSNEAKEVQKEGGTDSDSTTDADTTADAKAKAKSDADIQSKLKERAQYVAQVNYAKSSVNQAKVQAVTQFLNAAGSAAKLAGGALTYQSDLLNADASEEKALADFQNTAASNQLDFSNELRDYANSILSTIRDVESARHAASNAIANI